MASVQHSASLRKPVDRSPALFSSRLLIPGPIAGAGLPGLIFAPVASSRRGDDIHAHALASAFA
jgi:hypothetical protein